MTFRLRSKPPPRRLADVRACPQHPATTYSVASPRPRSRWTNHSARISSIGIFERFCAPTYTRVCAAFGLVAAFDGAKRIANLIKRKRMDKIRIGDVTKQAWQGMRERKPIEDAMAALEDIDWLRKPATAGPRGGRPPDHWLVNPKVHQASRHAE